MAYVPGYLHDVFISYACADDSEGLVQGFWKLLTSAIAARGLRIKSEDHPDGVDVFLDRRSLTSGDDLTEQVLTSARSTAVFVSLHSLAYMASSWCSQEAQEFTALYDPNRPKLNGRLFVISLSTEGSPARSAIDALRSRRFRRFYYVHKDGCDFPFDPANADQSNEDGMTLKEEARRLAGEIADTLDEMKKETPAPRVFIADTTRTAQADDMKRWLVQQQVTVMRASSAEESRALIEKADVFVDLFEPVPSATALEQMRMATEAKKPRVRWLQRGELAADKAQAMMAETQLIEETLEDFKEILKGMLKQPGERHKANTPQPDGADGNAELMVLLVGANNDLPCVEDLEKKLDEIQCGRDAFLSDDAASDASAWREELRKLLELHNPNGVIFVDGQCAGPWRDVRLRDLMLLLRDAAPRAKPALCAFPPAAKPNRRYRPPAGKVFLFDHLNLDKLKELL